MRLGADDRKWHGERIGLIRGSSQRSDLMAAMSSATTTTDRLFGVAHWRVAHLLLDPIRFELCSTTLNSYPLRLLSRKPALEVGR